MPANIYCVEWPTFNTAEAEPDMRICGDGEHNIIILEHFQFRKYATESHFLRVFMDFPAPFAYIYLIAARLSSGGREGEINRVA
ncbi:hypothetical protein ECG_04559 [Echinococcus granulosus]|uniref:Expressed protein n=1 Tax=Echinococcus granulosus TaxID=6210 RepID=A0A068WHK3_ECHGR|nr:hypothetical protein ECG_04559 [Echinococcus granulosus]CDS17154.1 expressed protein [Echinococcus granulosus]